MSVADPLEVPETEVVVSVLESMQSQLLAARKLLSLLRTHRAAGCYAEVEEQLDRAEAHLREAVKVMHTPGTPHTAEISPTIPWIAASPSEHRKQGAALTLRERGEILSRAVQARKLNNHTAICAEHDPVISQPH